MQTFEQRSRIVQYFKDEHAANGRAPSIRSVCAKFKLDTKSFYEIFPDGKREVCKLAGIPEDKQSFNRIAKASQALKGRKKKEQLENGERNVLRRSEEIIAAEVKRAQGKDEMRRRIRERELQLASTYEGRKVIFSSPRRLMKFVEDTTGYEDCRLGNHEVLDRFISFCEKHNLEPGSTLFRAVGPLECYEADVDEDGTPIDLADYIEIQLENYLTDREGEQRQKAMQARFEDILKNKCDFCGRPATMAFPNEGRLWCKCGAAWELHCPNCGREVRPDEGTSAVLHCSCGMSFTLPRA